MTSDSNSCFCVRISCIVVRNAINRFLNSCTLAFSSIACHFCSKRSINREQASSVSNISNFLHLYEPALHTIESPIENEAYFRAVNRTAAEEILQNRVDGSCLVRPYKENSELIKYIVSIHAQQYFFHLFIRHCDGNSIAIGQEKDNEKHFATPVEAINFYRLNKLQCTNKEVTLSFFLVPIS